MRSSECETSVCVCQKGLGRWRRVGEEVAQWEIENGEGENRRGGG